jgi:hypothetical protein
MRSPHSGEIPTVLAGYTHRVRKRTTYVLIPRRRTVSDAGAELLMLTERVSALRDAFGVGYPEVVGVHMSSEVLFISLTGRCFVDRRLPVSRHSRRVRNCAWN